MEKRLTGFWNIGVKTMITHTITYFVIGILAFTLFNYSAMLADPNYSGFMRQASDPLVRAGVLFQPIRGFLFGIVFYLLRSVFFQEKRGWLILWTTLVIVGIVSPFSTAPGSIEGFIYTKSSGLSPGLLEILVQSLLLSVVTFYWVRHSQKWLNWILGFIFFITLSLPALGLLVSRQ
ncbi:MAG: hypothetical protein ACM3YE_15410 [Bacteroidota bacterium]